MKTCQACKGPLVDGPDVDREATIDGITCRVRGIPTRRCAAGCAGVYWYWLDFGAEVYNGWSSHNERVAKRSWLVIKPRHLCRVCKSTLTDAGRTDTFEFPIPLRKGVTAVMSLTAPALSCVSCDKLYLPALLSKFDPFYDKLSKTLDAALVKDLIYR